MSEIFISYIHEDEIVAKALKTFLEAKLHARVFVASDQLRLGDEWLSKIRTALKSAKVVLALFSPKAMERPWVNFEAGGAWFSDNKTLIPICIGDLNPANLPKPYSNIQGASLDCELPSGSWYIVQDLWKILEVKSLSPAPFSFKDEDVDALSRALSHWKEAERAMAAYKRRTGEDAPET
jgi:hypothetical protein